ncbi:MAG: M23 family metallopeptidase, partial [Verrucomicrobiia bacterium]
RRDPSGEPIDPVLAVADGKVVYRTRVGATSGYGQYIVIEHLWESAPYYSLYAHLNRIDVSESQNVRQGEQIGLLGYTGTGINKARAHLHFEINLFLSTYFERWHSEFFPSKTNHHGVFNGINLAGFDVASFYLEHNKNPSLTPAQFLSRLTPHFTVRVPAIQPPQVARRYPWMAPQRLTSRTGAWDVSFDSSGLPLKVVPSPSSVQAPVIVSIRQTGAPHRLVTRNLVQGAGSQASLTDGGTRLIRLLFME